MLLCDHAQVADGKLFINGGGISRFQGPGLPPSTSIALLLLVPWESTNEPIQLELHLLTEDGQVVVDNAGVRRSIAAQIEVGRPPGVERGIPMEVPLALLVGGVYLPPGRYTWQLNINGTTHEAWQTSFSVVTGASA